jgi:hypothetical protein
VRTVNINSMTVSQLANKYANQELEVGTQREIIMYVIRGMDEKFRQLKSKFDFFTTSGTEKKKNEKKKNCKVHISNTQLLVCNIIFICAEQSGGMKERSV